MAAQGGRRRSSILRTTLDFEKLRKSDETPLRASVANPDCTHLDGDSEDAASLEKEMTLVQTIKLYWPGMIHSLLMSIALIMEGFDTILLANFFGLEQFNEKFGTQNPDGKFEISSVWKSALTNGVTVGEILGLSVTGVLQDRFGYRKTVMGALTMLTGVIFVNFFARDIKMLLAGEILCGIPWGCLQTITTAYASDVCPPILRPYLTTWTNLCWVIGQITASGVLRAMNDRNDQWAYRIPFALQWMWPLPILVGCFFAPESPYWLVRHDRLSDAKKSLLRLTSGNHPTFDVEKKIAEIVRTNEVEIKESSGTQYWDCFKGINLRRTEIVTVTWIIQILCGGTFMGYSTVFFQAAGLGDDEAFDMSIGLFGAGAVGTLVSWGLMQKIGRRYIYLCGSVFMFVLLIIVGSCGLSPRDDKAAQRTIGALLIVFTFTYDLTVGPVCYSLVSELPSTRLKAKSMSIARMSYNVAMIVANIITNYQLTTKAQGGWNWGAKSAFFWAGTNFVVTIWQYFRLPEPKGRSYLELDILFEHQIPARQFKHTPVDTTHAGTLDIREKEMNDSSSEKSRANRSREDV